MKLLYVFITKFIISLKILNIRIYSVTLNFFTPLDIYVVYIVYLFRNKILK